VDNLKQVISRKLTTDIELSILVVDARHCRRLPVLF